VIVKVNVLLLPPLVHPRSPELPLGVLTTTLAVPGPEIRVVVSVTCSCVLLTTVVASVSPLITTTDAETKWDPLTDRTKPSTVENAIVSVERDEISGDGRALRHNGLIALQPVRTSKRHNIALRHRTGIHAEVMIAAYTRMRRGKWSQLLEGNMRSPNRTLLFLRARDTESGVTHFDRRTMSEVEMLNRQLTGPAQELFSLWPYQPNLQTKDWGPTVSSVGHPTVETSITGKSLGCELLAQEVLGFFFFVVPLLQLLGT
jgi:hypothetical protein